MADGGPLRIGILGAARIAPTALIEPARERIATLARVRRCSSNSWSATGSPSLHAAAR